MGLIACVFFKIQNALTKGGIRSDEADEIAGLDRPEMGVLAYDNLQIREIDIVGIDPAEDIVLATGGRLARPDDRSVDRTTGSRLRSGTAPSPRGGRRVGGHPLAGARRLASVVIRRKPAGNVLTRIATSHALNLSAT